MPLGISPLFLGELPHEGTPIGGGNPLVNFGNSNMGANEALMSTLLQKLVGDNDMNHGITDVRCVPLTR